jgi:hypothetical protein
MRKKEHEKNWNPGSAEIPGLAASLDRIFKQVDAEGLGEGTAVTLKDDICRVQERFGVSTNGAVLLAAILENSPKNGCDDEDLSGYIGC